MTVNNVRMMTVGWVNKIDSTIVLGSNVGLNSLKCLLTFVLSFICRTATLRSVCSRTESRSTALEVSLQTVCLHEVFHVVAN